MADQKVFFTVNIMGEDYLLLRLLFGTSPSRPSIEDIGLTRIDLVPYFMIYINSPIYEYPVSMRKYIVDIHILINWLCYRNMDKWNTEAVKYSEELRAYLDGTDMSVEKNRLKTFKNWPHTFIDVNKLAKTGFYFSGPLRDVVKCHFCNVRLCDWVEGDDEIEEHLRWSKFCPLLRRIITNNRPISTKEFDNLLTNVCGYHEMTSNDYNYDLMNIGEYQTGKRLRLDHLNTQLNCLLDVYKEYVKVTGKYQHEVGCILDYAEKLKSIYNSPRFESGSKTGHFLFCQYMACKYSPSLCICFKYESLIETLISEIIRTVGAECITWLYSKTMY